MRLARAAVVAAALIVLTAFASAPEPMPPNTLLFSDFLQQVSRRPGFTDALLKDLDSTNKRSGPALLTPSLVNHLRTLIANHSWPALDRFPGWTMAEITPTVGALSRIEAGRTEPQAIQQQQDLLEKFLDVGPYTLVDRGLAPLPVIDFRDPSKLPPFTTDGIVSSLGAGVTRGDGPNELAPEHAESQRLADVLNRLSANTLDGVTTLQATWSDSRSASTPEGLINAILQSGHTVVVTDTRYFANFTHLHFNEQDVMSPFWVNSQILIPGTKRPLLVPVSHAEYEWHIRGPILNADVSFYFGIDGKAEFRTMDTLDQAWVMKRDAHIYRQADAVEVTRLAGAALRAYMRLHQAHPTVPFGGYYAFGVCQDVVAAIELKMNGATTLFPNTADDRFFIAPQADPRDAEIDELIRRLPKDRTGKPPAIERIFGSLPVGSSTQELQTVTIPGLGADLIAVHDAWIDGTVHRTESERAHRLKLAALAAAILLAGLVVAWRMRPKKTPEFYPF